MPRFLILSLVLGVGVVVGRMFDGVPSTAEAGGGQGVVECATKPDVTGAVTPGLCTERTGAGSSCVSRAGRRGVPPVRAKSPPIAS